MREAARRKALTVQELVDYAKLCQQAQIETVGIANCVKAWQNKWSCSGVSAESEDFFV